MDFENFFLEKRSILSERALKTESFEFFENLKKIILGVKNIFFRSNFVNRSDKLWSRGRSRDPQIWSRYVKIQYLEGFFCFFDLGEI